MPKIGGDRIPPSEDLDGQKQSSTLIEGGNPDTHALDGQERSTASTEGAHATAPPADVISSNPEVSDVGTEDKPSDAQERSTTSTNSLHATAPLADVISSNPEAPHVGTEDKLSHAQDRSTTSAESLDATALPDSVIPGNPDVPNISTEDRPSNAQNRSTTPTQDLHATALPAGVVSGNPEVPSIGTEGKPSDAQNRSMRLRKFRQTWIPTINLALGVLAFLVLAYQVNINTQEVQIMEKSFRVSERAYVGVSEVKFYDKSHDIVILINNTGHVPARAVTLKVYDVRTIGDADPKGAKTPWEAGEVELLPGTPMPMVITLQSFEEGELDAILTKKEVLYIGGTIHYDDGFGKSEKTTFAFQYVPPPIDRWVAHSDLSKLFKRKEP